MSDIQPKNNPCEENISEKGEEEDFDFYYDYAKAAQNRSERWTEENWQEEMEKHPLFMTESPKPGQKPSELVEALSQLKYDPEFNSIQELLSNYRVDGNENFRNKRYRWAVDSYSEGIRIAHQHLKSSDQKLEDKSLIEESLSTLYNNRASAHFHLQNYRSSMEDATRAIVLNPDNHKSILRFAQCCIQLKKYQACIDFCREKLAQLEELNLDENIKAQLRTNLENILLEAQNKLKFENRDKRKMARTDAKITEQQRKIEEAVRQRGIKFHGSLFHTDHSAAWGHFVHFDPDNPDLLIWPVVFIYPESGQTDFIEKFCETSTFYEYIEMMFNNENPPEWDPQGKYRPETINCFYHSYQSYVCDGEEKFQIQLKKFDPRLRLIDVLQFEDHIIQNALPTFVLKLNE